MKYLPACALLMVFMVAVAGTKAQQAPPVPKPDAVDPPQEEQVEVSQPTPSAVAPASRDAGAMEPAEVKELLRKIYLAQFRIDDLLTQVQPDRWKMEESTRSSFQQTLENLRSQLNLLETWRSQFEKRHDSMYLGYQTHVAINGILPRLDAVAASVSRYENPSLGSQYDQVRNQLFDLQQLLQPYVGYLLKAPDQMLQLMQANLAACHNELGYAMRSRSEPAKPMTNIMPELKGWKVRKAKEAAAREGQTATGGTPQPAKAVAPASKPVPTPKSSSSKR